MAVIHPALDSATRTRLTHELMDARRDKGAAIRVGDAAAREAARLRVDAAKVALGERGPPWWTDGTPDVNRRMAENTGYAGWWTDVGQNTAEAVPKAETERP